MAEHEKKSEPRVDFMADEGGQPGGGAGGAPQAGAPQSEVHVDDSLMVATYSNFCRVTATPEEVILDFGLNPQPFATGPHTVKVAQRLVMNFYTAKRLLGALQLTIQRHEATFGPIELDVRRRAGQTPAQGAGPGR